MLSSNTRKRLLAAVGVRTMGTLDWNGGAIDQLEGL
jgi:hypothetical protein